MCLLIKQPAGTVFTEKFLKGVYALNEDGIGVMYAENDTIYIHKALCKTYEQVEKFMKDHVEGRECAVHFRMQTHGDINLLNCHPYEVITEAEGYPLWLMHNGVLATGNAKDKTKSDTWHYIQDVLRPMLLKNPEFYKTQAFADVVGGHIGSGNKFALINAEGFIALVNEKQGVQYNGAWLSNTYAWDTTGTEHGFTNYGWYNSYGYGAATYNKSTIPLKHRIGADFSYEDESGYGAAISDKYEWLDATQDYTNELFLEGDITIISEEALELYYDAVGSVRAWETLDYVYEGLMTYEQFVGVVESLRAAPELLDTAVAA